MCIQYSTFLNLRVTNHADLNSYCRASSDLVLKNSALQRDLAILRKNEKESASGYTHAPYAHRTRI